MEFAEKLSALAAKVRQQRDAIQTEEATKNAFVMPFISTILGYDVFNPMEVVPEFIADVGLKKIDYAIVKDGEVQILIECKKSTEPVKIEHASQLFRYFAVTSARIAILTNGEDYQFFTDLDAPNRMDAKPFLVLDLNDIDESLIPELQKLSKDVFDLDSIISAAGELKYIGELKRTLASQFKEPEDEWVKFLTGRVYSGPYTQKVREQFTALVAKASKQFLNDQVNERLKKALGAPGFPQNDDAVIAASVTSAPAAEADLAEADGLETTLEEIEGYQIVRAHRLQRSEASSHSAEGCQILFRGALGRQQPQADRAPAFQPHPEVHRHFRRQQGRDAGSHHLVGRDLRAHRSPARECQGIPVTAPAPDPGRVLSGQPAP
jgi:hypothetical protein